MSIDDLIAGFAELVAYQGARFEWNATIQLDEKSPYPDSHSIRLVPGFGVPGAQGQFEMLLQSAAELVPPGDDNPGRTPIQKFIVTVFREASSMIDLDRSPLTTSPIGWEGDGHGNDFRVRLESQSISSPARACIMVLRKSRSRIESRVGGAVAAVDGSASAPALRPHDLDVEIQTCTTAAVQHPTCAIVLVASTPNRMSDLHLVPFRQHLMQLLSQREMNPVECLTTREITTIYLQDEWHLLLFVAGHRSAEAIIENILLQMGESSAGRQLHAMMLQAWVRSTQPIPAIRDTGEQVMLRVDDPLQLGLVRNGQIELIPKDGIFIWTVDRPFLRLATAMRAATSFQPNASSTSDVGTKELLTRKQIGARVHRSKSTVKRWLEPIEPDIAGRGGAESLWDWNRVKPICEEHLGTKFDG